MKLKAFAGACSRPMTLAQCFGVPRVFSDYADAIPEVDAAIVSLPHSLHAPVSKAFLAAGRHVLVEKPMGINAAECRELVEIASANGLALAVGHMRRFQPGLRLAKAWLDRGLIGPVRSFDFRDGYTYAWPVASDFFFRKEAAGGGVLFDTGAHTLDLLLWFLGEVAEFTYRDDAHGGVEADSLVEVTVKSGAKGVVELSRTRILRNTAIIKGESGSIEAFFHKPELVFRPTSGPATVVTAANDGPDALPPGLVQMLHDQLVDWSAAIDAGRAPAVSGEDGLSVVALMEQMYLQRAPLDFPWADTSELMELAS